MSSTRPTGHVTPTGALGYFQHLASGGRNNPPAIAKDSIAFYTGSIERSPDRLTQRSVLQQRVNPYLQGAIWVEGLLPRTGNQVPVRCPVLFRPVVVVTRTNASNEHLHTELRSRKKWSVTPGLLSPEATSRVVAHLGRGSDELDLGPDSALVASARTAIAEAFGASTEPHVDARRLGVWDGNQPNPAALQGWTTQNAHSTAFEHLYDAAPADPDPTPVAAPALQCPLPLNEQQEQIVRRATNESLVVVSGPPGTGKTHLVAAVALQQFSEGRSTLIATASEAASDSIAEMLARFPMVTAIRFGGDVPPQILGNQLAEGVPDGESQFTTVWTRAQLELVDTEIADITSQLKLRLQATEVNDGVIALRRTLPGWAPQTTNLDQVAELQALAGDARRPGRAAMTQRSWALRKLRRSLKAPRTASLHDLDAVLDALIRIAASEAPVGDVPTARLWEQLEVHTDQRSLAAANHLEALRRTDTSAASRRTLGQLATSLRHPHPVERQLALAAQSDAFIDTVPLWFGTLQDLDNALPIRPGLFDLVIFDEASQASQAHGVSALMRAGRALVIGDPRQMRHSPISTPAQRKAASAAAGLSEEASAQLDEAGVSLFDAAAHQAPVTRLAEHFRCAPHIIGFSNERFYNDRLRLMTQHPGRESRDAIHIVHPPGDEIKAVIAEVRKLSRFGARSIGVVAGHSAHARIVREALNAEIPMHERKRLALRVGTPREFQGIERDSIIISPGISATDLHLLDELQDPNTFNVVASRAQNDVYVVTALKPEDLPDGLLRDYLAWSHLPPQPFASQTVGAGWKGDLARDLAALNDMRVIVDYPVGGHEVDLAIGVERLAFGVETSVHPQGVDAHIERHLALRRAGWRMLDAFETDWRGRQSECVAWLATQWAHRSGQSVQ